MCKHAEKGRSKLRRIAAALKVLPAAAAGHATQGLAGFRCGAAAFWGNRGLSDIRWFFLQIVLKNLLKITNQITFFGTAINSKIFSLNVVTF